MSWDHHAASGRVSAVTFVDSCRQCSQWGKRSFQVGQNAELSKDDRSFRVAAEGLDLAAFSLKDVTTRASVSLPVAGSSPKASCNWAMVWALQCQLHKDYVAVGVDRGIARAGFGWSKGFESHCATIKFT
jgi:hypothetical protein